MTSTQVEQIPHNATDQHLHVSVVNGTPTAVEPSQNELLHSDERCTPNGTHLFRSYDTASDMVRKTYALNHKYQTLDYVLEQKNKYIKRLKTKKGPNKSIWEVLEYLSTFHDESDPDTESSQMIHAIQSAEAARQKGHPEWFQVTLLVHDLGKYMSLLDGLPQWSVVGDIFPVGAAPAKSIVYHEYFAENPDFASEDSKYNTKLGIYEEHCGFENLHFSVGHDDYLYQVLSHNTHNLPEEALYLIRYHSFYPWHRDFSYDHFASEKDFKMREKLQQFSQCDLYSKTDVVDSLDNLTTRYKALLEKYFPENLHW
uniref:Inositol oxygenase n=1 Tax=Percolomonas cosmopolitus TaxID=63605 RepID=A0A7S1KNP5_9EUKA|eukprot:CAMPEP_0117450212 /NCGR_PEP_ID=MMETSP0759-20121206/8349_1 /TAXON_ID=63605 /ORGANISM="Percolomonas cosmopolitus, Strain WS" /LENGTH=312 /DNA_ID=CAMNT_0005242721 /DNA_START=49 /DNA_END=984 /DNA_ORIENTATION=-